MIVKFFFAFLFPRVNLEDFDSLIVLDMEWNSPTNRYHKTENGITLRSDIIQIGAVKVDRNLQQISTYNALMHPETYQKMNPHVIEVTEITDDMLVGKPTFRETAPGFLDWCGPNAAFFTWSTSDIDELADNLTFYGLDHEIDRLPRCFDMQPMFDDQITMDGRDFALSYAIWKLDIDQSGLAHNAFSDALNTLAVMKHLDFSEGIEYYEV